MCLGPGGGQPKAPPKWEEALQTRPPPRRSLLGPGEEVLAAGVPGDPAGRLGLHSEAPRGSLSLQAGLCVGRQSLRDPFADGWCLAPVTLVPGTRRLRAWRSVGPFLQGQTQLGGHHYAKHVKRTRKASSLSRPVGALGAALSGPDPNKPHPA